MKQDNIENLSFKDKFKVIQLCDTHFNRGNFEESLLQIEQIIQAVKPDLAIFTGDNVEYDLEIACYERINDVFVKNDVKWMLILGNHDGEFTRATRKEIIEKCSNFTHCLTSNSEKKKRYGDTIVRLLSGDKLIAEIVAMDSGDYEKIGLSNKYARIIPEQVDWYKKNTISQAKFVYLHIPQHEFYDAYKNIKKEEYIYGKIRENRKPSGRKKLFAKAVCVPGRRSSFFNETNDGTLKAIFVGHDHLNDSNVKYKGVHLVYGQKTCYGGYNCLKRGFKDNMGTTLLTINSDSSFDIKPIKYLAIGQFRDLGDCNGKDI